MTLRTELIANFERAATRQRSVLLTTHSMEEAEALCTRMLILVNGKMKVNRILYLVFALPMFVPFLQFNLTHHAVHRQFTKFEEPVWNGLPSRNPHLCSRGTRTSCAGVCDVTDLP